MKNLVGYSAVKDAEGVVCACKVCTPRYICNMAMVDSIILVGCGNAARYRVPGKGTAKGRAKGREASPCMPVLTAATHKLATGQLLLLTDLADWR